MIFYNKGRLRNELDKAQWKETYSIKSCSGIAGLWWAIVGLSMDKALNGIYYNSHFIVLYS